MNRQMIKMLKGLATAMVVASILFAFLISGVRILGFDVFGVLTGSMEPAYPVGSLIYVKPVDTQQLRVNDVITFSVTPGVIATHRIVEVVPDENNPLVVRYRTKGDANNDVDAALVSAGNIVGKVMFCMPALGHVASYIQEPPGLYVAILVCVLMIAFVFFTDSLDEKMKKKGKKGAKKKGFDWAPIVNPISQALLGRPLIRRKRTRKKLQEEDSLESAYRTPRAQQAPQAQRAPQASHAPQAVPYGAYDPRYAQPQNRGGYAYPPQQQAGYAPQNPQYPPYGAQQGYGQQPYYPQQQRYGQPQQYGYPQQRGYSQAQRPVQPVQPQQYQQYQRPVQQVQQSMQPQYRQMQPQQPVQSQVQRPAQAQVQQPARRRQPMPDHQQPRQ